MNNTRVGRSQRTNLSSSSPHDLSIYCYNIPLKNTNQEFYDFTEKENVKDESDGIIQTIIGVTEKPYPLSVSFL
ncbi:unnamed protein product [Lactuca virosa]|uniref:Uncharacterized protein n=1 Tax=Lactuca virosa TaxID=75947 RepID=A0AAU9LRA5_9ASTR|nr:unnamed protein product [Lactuca virosa]